MQLSHFFNGYAFFDPDNIQYSDQRHGARTPEIEHLFEKTKQSANQSFEFAAGSFLFGGLTFLSKLQHSPEEGLFFTGMVVTTALSAAYRLHSSRKGQEILKRIAEQGNAALTPE